MFFPCSEFSSYNFFDSSRSSTFAIEQICSVKDFSLESANSMSSLRAPISIGVISIFLRAIVLQTDSPTECIHNPTLRVACPNKPILAVFSPTNRSSYSSVGLSMVIKTSVS